MAYLLFYLSVFIISVHTYTLYHHYLHWKIHTIKPWGRLIGRGYNVKSKNQNTLISATCRRSWAHNKIHFAFIFFILPYIKCAEEYKLNRVLMMIKFTFLSIKNYLVTIIKKKKKLISNFIFTILNSNNLQYIF